MNTKELVSIVIPTYNAANFIVDTILSVLNQSHSDLEVIVVDDCSTDDTVSIVKKMCDEDFRIRLVSLEKNMGGPAGPRNIGVAAAGGKWVCFLDADASGIFDDAADASNFKKVIYSSRDLTTL